MSGYKIAYVIPYFGNLREDINIWLTSCKYNSDIDFLLFTDDKRNYNFPSNVKVYYMSFDTMNNLINKKIGFEVALSKPYKLCDLKPAYGDIFSDYLVGYDFWGHCDMDLIWGRIRNFITDDILATNDKVGILGHSILYRNDEIVNKRYKNTVLGINYTYKEVFSTDKGYHFDEEYINRIYDQYNYPSYKKVHFADLTEYHYNFFLTNVSKSDNYGRQIFEWRDGRLIRHYVEKNEHREDEFMYIHFLKRKMKLNIENYENITRLIIIPNEISDSERIIDAKYIKKCGAPHWFKYFLDLYTKKKKTISIMNFFPRLIHRMKKYYLLAMNNDNLNDNENYRK